MGVDRVSLQEIPGFCCYYAGMMHFIKISCFSDKRCIDGAVIKALSFFTTHIR
jgi:hypothetical protein